MNSRAQLSTEWTFRVPLLSRLNEGRQCRSREGCTCACWCRQGKRVPRGDSTIDRTDGDDEGVVADDFLVCWLEIKGARKVVREIDEKV
jgi:hypothetical protein